MAAVGEGQDGGDGSPPLGAAVGGVGLGAVQTAELSVRRVAAVVLGGPGQAGPHLLPHVLHGEQGGVHQEVRRLEANLWRKAWAVKEDTV